ncbi:hypothetical protein EV421DRAFT_2018441 [Armillaria borealis]|uniref:Uncharacterized protein n=1 Tax=Armillaria borealis TaxID=47425 RepID=A0AA39MT37_9AGAR|nr:hypothetical protein EV421DRAFT_2018441 [Armillaria borealis]
MPWLWKRKCELAASSINNQLPPKTGRRRGEDPKVNVQGPENIIDACWKRGTDHEGAGYKLRMIMDRKVFDNEDVEEARHRVIDMLVASERHGRPWDRFKNFRDDRREFNLLFVTQKKKIHKRTDGHEDLQIFSRSLVKLMGGKRNHPFDHEQKFPEDKQYEELGPTARV